MTEASEGATPADRLTVWQKLARVQSSIGEVAKTGRHDQQRYDYIEEHGTFELLRPYMRQLDFCVVVETADELTVETKVPFGNKGVPATLVTLKGSVEMIDGPTGTSIKKWYAGQGIDTQDKASNKAQTYLTKYALQKFFLIPTQHIDDEGQGVEESAPPAQEQASGQAPAQASGQPAQTAPVSAQDAPIGEENAVSMLTTIKSFIDDGQLDRNKVRAKLATFQVPMSQAGVASLSVAKAGEFRAWLNTEVAKAATPA